MENPSKVYGVVIVAIIAILFYQSFSPGDKNEDLIISAWQSVIRRPHRKFEKLAVGINAAVDLIVSGVDLLEALKVPSGKQKDHDVLNSLVDLQETFHNYFALGVAAERPFLNKALFTKICQTADKLEKKQYYIGGNAALIADKVAYMFPNVKIHFVGPVGPRLLRMFEESITVPRASQIIEDEVHLIMEYGVNDTWGSARSPTASRFITSHDESNSGAVMLETFFTSLENYDPDLVVLSGLHMIESIGEEKFQQRLAVLLEGLEALPMTVPVHLELASMANVNFTKYISDQVLSQVSSLGLNEQELASILAVVKGPHTDLLDNQHQPVIAKVSDTILYLLKTYGHSTKRRDNRLTRIHFHSLKFHIIGVRPTAWKNLVASVAVGTRIAGRQACDTDEITSDDVELRIPAKFTLFTGDTERELDMTSPVITWEQEGFYFVFSPVLVCRHPIKTVGLGDAISAAGLMFSEFNPYFYKH